MQALLSQVYWRAPTERALTVVSERLRERQTWQRLIRERSKYQQDPDSFSALSRATQRSLALRFQKLDQKIAQDRTLLYFPFAQQQRFHQCTLWDEPGGRKAIKAKTRIADCGNRSGKTMAGSVEAVWWATGTHPYLFTPAPPLTVWYVALDFPHSRDINKPILDRFMPEGARWNAQARSWTLPNGSEIVLKSQEAGRAKFQGGNVPLCVWDEEGNDPEESKSIYTECLVRTWDESGQIVMTLTPIEQYAWICELIEKGRDGDPEIEVHSWSGLDNPYVPTAEIEGMRFESEEEEQVRKYGALIPLGTRTIFNKSTLRLWHEECRNAIFHWGALEKHALEGDLYAFKELRPSPEPTSLRVYEWPTKHDFYIVCVDTSGGVGANYSVAIVLARVPLRVVAVFRSNVVPVPEFAVACMMLGHAYFQHRIDAPALLAAEENNHGHGLLTDIMRARYRKLWYRPKETKFGYEDFPGWRTDTATRPVLESAVQVAIEENAIQIRDVRIVEECLRYERNALTGRTGAPRGQHDDTVIALGIGLAVHAIEPLPAFAVPPPPPDERALLCQPTAPPPRELRRQAKRTPWRKNQVII